MAPTIKSYKSEIIALKRTLDVLREVSKGNEKMLAEQDEVIHHQCAVINQMIDEKVNLINQNLVLAEAVSVVSDVYLQSRRGPQD